MVGTNTTLIQDDDGQEVVISRVIITQKSVLGEIQICFDCVFLCQLVELQKAWKTVMKKSGKFKMQRYVEIANIKHLG